jgi:tryptophan synthase alpha chain
MSVHGALDILADFRRTHQTPVVLFTYLNPIHRFGLDSFVSAAFEAGAQGLLVTDLPVGSDPDMESRLSTAGLDLIRLIAPTTELERAHNVSESASGFLYYISRTGVTGARELLRSGLQGEVAALREVTDLPIAVGFGISTAEQAAVVADIADGVVVGSALLERVSEGGVPAGGRFLAGLRASMDRGGA